MLTPTALKVQGATLSSPAVREKLTPGKDGDDETVRLPLPVSMLSPLAASKRPVGALGPTDVAFFPTSHSPAAGAFSPAEGSLKEASHTPGTLSPGGCPDNQPYGPSARTAALY